MSDCESSRWDAVRQRSTGQSFVYAVKTTGIFCKPGCPSRMPLRPNVEFFDSAEAARARGYRACKRCKPAMPSTPALPASLLAAARKLAEESGVRSDEVAAAVGLSRSHFQRAFKKYFGVTPGQYRRRALAERARSGISTATSVTHSAVDAGYASTSSFYASVAKELGMPAAVANKRASGEVVTYATAQSTLGQVLVAWTQRGVCAVFVFDHEPDGARALRSRFPEAELHEAPKMHSWVDEVIKAVDGKTDVRLPLDLRGTAFQEQVWQALRSIPPGETRTYGEIAASIASEKHARAVGSACSQNPVAVLVPCHRVVRADGGLGEYRWGTNRKQLLLTREKNEKKTDL